MSFDYDEIATTAAELIEEFGASAVLKRITSGEYDPATGSTSLTETAVPVIACVFDYPLKAIDGTLILSGDRQAYLSGASTPQPEDLLTWQGADYRVVSVKPLAPAGRNVLNELQLRK